MTSHVAGCPRSDRPPEKPTAPGMSAVRAARDSLQSEKVTTPGMRAVRPSQHSPGSRDTPPSSGPSLAPARGPLVSLDLSLREDDDVPTLVTARVSRSVPAGVGVRDRAALIRLDGGAAGQATLLSRGTQRLGRGRDADIRIDDDGVSRVHAAVVHENGTWVLVDLGSKNGTLVEGEPILRRTLAEGDVIQLGPRALFRFVLMDERQEEIYRRIYESSIRDVLTGAFNRHHFDERLRTELAFATRHRTAVSLLLFDLDHFKRINDTYGHPAGDAVLRYVAAIVTARLRAEDVFARYGGEEFAVLLRGIDLAGAARAAERLRGAVAGSRPTFDGQLVPVTISIGCASLACCSPPAAAELVSIADRRLYAAKHGGRNRVCSSG